MKQFVSIPGSVAIITGAGSGIGRACAVSLAHRGATVVVTDLDPARAESVAAEIEGAGGSAIAMSCDTTDLPSIEAVRDVTLRRFGRIDIVMNNVGVIAMGNPQDIPIDEWQRIFDINLMSIVRSNHVFLPILIGQGSGHIVNTGSASGLLAHGFDRMPYVASKHGVVGMTEAMALYLRPKGVGVTLLCPSGVVTNILEQIRFFGAPTTPRSPDHRIVEAHEVGELVADAVATGQFFVVTAPEINVELAERAADMNAYIDQLTEENPS